MNPESIIVSSQPMPSRMTFDCIGVTSSTVTSFVRPSSVIYCFTTVADFFSVHLSVNGGVTYQIHWSLLESVSRE